MLNFTCNEQSNFAIFHITFLMEILHLSNIFLLEISLCNSVGIIYNGKSTSYISNQFVATKLTYAEKIFTITNTFFLYLHMQITELGSYANSKAQNYGLFPKQKQKNALTHNARVKSCKLNNWKKPSKNTFFNFVPFRKYSDNNLFFSIIYFGCRTDFYVRNST